MSGLGEDIGWTDFAVIEEGVEGRPIMRERYNDPEITVSVLSIIDSSQAKCPVDCLSPQSKGRSSDTQHVLTVLGLAEILCSHSPSSSLSATACSILPCTIEVTRLL
jgi:hypothetical protein